MNKCFVLMNECAVLMNECKNDQKLHINPWKIILQMSNLPFVFYCFSKYLKIKQIFYKEL